MLDLKKYVPDGRVSTGLLARWQGMLVWAVAQQKYWQFVSERAYRIPVVGLGGGQEEGETLEQTIAREVREEACSRVGLQSSPRTLWVRPDGCTEEVLRLGASEVNPLLIWQRAVTMRDEAGQPRQVDYINAVYDGELLDKPQPGAELPGLLFTLPGVFLQMLDRDYRLSELEEAGANYTGLPIPADSLFFLQGSAYYLAKYYCWSMRCSVMVN